MLAVLVSNLFGVFVRLQAVYPRGVVPEGLRLVRLYPDIVGALIGLSLPDNFGEPAGVQFRGSVIGLGGVRLGAELVAWVGVDGFGLKIGFGTSSSSSLESFFQIFSDI